MRTSLWAYPWDVQSVGFAAAAAELREAADGVSLATSYHAGRFISPRSAGGKVYFPEDGTIYFAPTSGRWERSRLQPVVSSVVSRGDVLRQFCDARDRTGLAVNAWTVCLHNMRLGLLHPDACTQTAFGDVNSFSLCPSHPDARAYAIELVEDLTKSYRPDSVELETPSFMPFAHGFHHEKDGVGLTAEDDFLLSLCFCPACVAGAKRAGVDAEAARRAVVSLVTEAMERARPEPRWPDFAGNGPAVIAQFPEIVAYADWRTEPVTSLVAEIRDRADPASKVYVIDGVDGYVCGCDHAALADACDGLILCAYDMAPEAVAAAIERGRRASGQKYLGAGLRVGYPEIPGAADLRAKALAAAGAGADGVNFYNYGLIPKPRLDWVRDALKS